MSSAIYGFQKKGSIKKISGSAQALKGEGEHR
jgi:hypothetical protein